MSFDSMSPSSPVRSGEKASPQVTPDLCSKHEAYLNEGVKDPRPNDVLCGRGGSINSHPGNERFRQLVDKRKRVYLTARFKREKRLIASSIVSEIRALDPPGRFLQQDKASGLWKDIGDEKARDKTSQALRENAPKIRADIETEINVQRAEMQKEDERSAVAAHQQPQQQPSSSAPPPPPPGYYPPPPSGWGAYPPPPPYYHGYGHPPHPHHPHGAPPPPHPSYYPPPHTPHPHEGHWSYYPPPPPHSHHHPHAPPAPPQAQEPKSSVQQTADYIASGAESVSESVKKWVDPFGFGRQERNSAGDHHGDHNSVNSKPLPYVHEDASKKRRMVKFSSDTKRNCKRSYSRRNSANSMTNSILSGSSQDATDLEPHGMDEDIENRSLMSSVANHILGSIGSWDTTSILCGMDNTDRDSVPFPGSQSGATTAPQDGDVMEEDDMNVEWEGQEVQLMEKNDHDSVASEDRMPPPPRQVQHHENHSIAFSSLGSCHSWMPEQFNDAASSFFGSIRSSSQGHHHFTQDVQMEQQMDYSVHTENFSAGGSIGGNSLTRVFEHDPMPDATASALGSPNMNQRVLNQVPSWERSFRSRSPLSVGSDEGDDISLISKESSKMSGANSRDGGISVSPVNTPRESGSLWGSKE